MEEKEFSAYVVEEQNGKFIRKIKQKTVNDLPPGDLLIKVHYSSLNYKDALSATGNKGVTKEYPHTPGIDAVGKVAASETNKFKIDDPVIVTSYDLGMNTDGGFGQYIRVPSDWAVKHPPNITMKETMALGTAGLTAGMSVLRLTERLQPEDGKIVVSGATGGVGSLSVSILSKLGYNVSAITGKEAEHNYLLQIGANEIIPRSDFETTEKKPMLKSAFAGGIDTVGGPVLENMLKSIRPMGIVSCCGNIASPELNLTVYPFILRGITLNGITSQNLPMKYRTHLWEKLASEWKPEQLSETCTEITLDKLSEKIDLMRNGKLKGRTIVKPEVRNTPHDTEL